MNTTHPKHLCKVCGQMNAMHRITDNACPGAAKFPVWPKSIKDEAKAGALYDKRVAKFWAASPGTFQEV